MHELHDIIHAETVRHAVIIRAVNEVPIGGINPAGANYRDVRVCAGRLKIGTHTSLAIMPINPTQ